MRTIIVACRTLSDELNMAMEETGCRYPVHWIPSGLHTDTGILKGKIQEELDRLTDIDQVLLAFGFCGNSLLGVTPSAFCLVFPRVDDCITLMLGSGKKRREISDEMNTYFLTKGWLDYEKNLLAEYRETVEKRGRAYADRVYRTLLQHYRRLGIIDTGAYDADEVLLRTRRVAKELNLELQRLPGTIDYVKRLLTGPWNEEFVTIQPGETVTLHHLFG